MNLASILISFWRQRTCTGVVNVLVMDSMGLFMSLNELTILQIARIYSIRRSKSFLEIQMLSVQQQKGAFDCALFAIANATEVCEGNNPEHVKYDQTKMRDHLLNCFGSRKLTTFPKMIEQEILPRPTRVYHKIEVFCYCRMPEEYDYLMFKVVPLYMC